MIFLRFIKLRFCLIMQMPSPLPQSYPALYRTQNYPSSSALAERHLDGLDISTLT